MYCQKGYNLLLETTLGKAQTKNSNSNTTPTQIPGTLGRQLLYLAVISRPDRINSGRHGNSLHTWGRELSSEVFDTKGRWRSRVLDKKKETVHLCARPVWMYRYTVSPVLRRVAAHDKTTHNQDGLPAKGIKRLQPSRNMVVLFKCQNERFWFWKKDPEENQKLEKNYTCIQMLPVDAAVDETDQAAGCVPPSPLLYKEVFLHFPHWTATPPVSPVYHDCFPGALPLPLSSLLMPLTLYPE